MNKIISTQHAPAAIGPYSQAIVANNFVFCSGQIGLNASGELVGSTIDDQTEQVLKNLEAVLTAAGSSLEKVTQTTCYLKNLEDFSAFNEIYGKYFDKNKPARATIGVSNLPKNALVEISCIAYL